MMTSGARSSSASGRRTRRRPRVTVVGVLGELLLTAGLVVFLYLFWQLWWNDMVVRQQQNSEGASISEGWEQNFQNESASADPVVPAEPGDGEIFAQLRVPRFGDDFVAQVAGGVSKSVTLDPIGIGHYPDTQLPGEPGNFAVAGHRNTHGAPLNQVASLEVGDPIVVETADGWFTYRFRSSEYVAPSAVDVLNAVPRTDSVEMDDSFITLTSCNPKMSTAERIIAYGVFDSWTPRSDGPPAALTGGEKG